MQENTWNRIGGFTIALGVGIYLILLDQSQPLLNRLQHGITQDPDWGATLQISIYALRLTLLCLSFLLAALLLITSTWVYRLLSGQPLHLPTPDTWVHLSLHRLRHALFLFLLPLLLAALTLWLSRLLFGLTPHSSLSLALLSLGISVWAIWQLNPHQTWLGQDPKQPTVLKGATLLSYPQAQTRARAQLQQYHPKPHLNKPPQPDPINWGGLPLPFATTSQHFFIQGAPGSGKTLTLRDLTQSLLHSLRTDQHMNHKGILYSKKNEELAYLSDLYHHQKLQICTPSDQRSIKPNLAQAIQDEAMAYALAQSLIPQDPNSSQPYFARTAQMLLTGLIQALMYHLPQTWTLRHLLLVSETPDSIRTVLKSSPQTQRYQQQHAQHDLAESTLQNVISELTGKLELYRPLAAYWEQIPDHRSLNLETWVKHQESILYFGFDTKRPQISAAAIRIFINLLSSLILSEPSNFNNPLNQHRRFFLLLDEFPSLERIDSLLELLAEGRDRGVCGVLGTQTWSQIHNTYGSDSAQSLLGQIAHKIFLRPEDELSEEKAQKLLGHHEILRRNLSTSHSWTLGTSLNHAHSEQSVPLVTSSELWDLPLPSPKAGIQGFGRSPGIGRYRLRAPFQPQDPDPSLSNFEPWPTTRSKSNLTLQPLSRAECQLLGLPEPAAKPIKPSSVSRATAEHKGKGGQTQQPQPTEPPKPQETLETTETAETTETTNTSQTQPPKRRRSLLLSQGWVEESN